MQAVADALEAARPQLKHTELTSAEAESERGVFASFLQTAIENGELGEKIRALFTGRMVGGARGERSAALPRAEAAGGSEKPGREEADEAETAQTKAAKGEKNAEDGRGRKTEGRKPPGVVRRAFLRLELEDELPRGITAQGGTVDSEEPTGKETRGKGRSGRIVETEALEGPELLAHQGKNESMGTVVRIIAEVPLEKGRENSGPSRESTAQGQSSGSRPKMVVVDLRGASSPQPKQEAAAAAGFQAHRSEPKRELRTEESARYYSRTFSGERTGVEGGRDSVGSSTKPGAARFQEILRNEVVRHSTIILKEGGGELRLILKPESLGRVRINLSLNNDHIAGRIVVENSSVKEMFESNLQNLQNAFKNEGYASASLEVSVGAGGEQARGQREPMEPGRRRVLDAAAEFESSVAVVPELPGEDWIVNLTV